MASDTHHRVAILVYDGVKLLDITGPARLATRSRPRRSPKSTGPRAAATEPRASTPCSGGKELPAAVGGSRG